VDEDVFIGGFFSRLKYYYGKTRKCVQLNNKGVFLFAEQDGELVDVIVFTILKKKRKRLTIGHYT
jgi:hypothetical protein